MAREMMGSKVGFSYPRPCVVADEGRVLLHGFFVHMWTHGASLAVGGFCAGQETCTKALVEYEDGRLETVAVGAVRMIDSAGLFSEYEWGGE